MKLIAFILLFATQSWAASLVHPYAPRATNMLFATHNHTDASPDQDYGLWATNYADFFASEGFHAFAVTEHIQVNLNTHGITNIIYVSGMESSAGIEPTDPSNGYHITLNWITNAIQTTNVQACLNHAWAQGGLACAAHPVTDPAWTYAQISTLSNLNGIEILGSGTGSESLWQELLANGQRDIYAWSSYDHMIVLTNTHGNYVFVDEVSSDALKAAMHSGNFYASRRGDYPRMELNIAVTNMTITVSERNGQTASWTWIAFPESGVTTNQVDSGVSTSSYTVSTNDVVVYFRAQKSSRDRAWSQPFWVEPEESGEEPELVSDAVSGEVRFSGDVTLK